MSHFAESLTFLGHLLQCGKLDHLLAILDGRPDYLHELLAAWR
jgi:hypothetical protein